MLIGWLPAIRRSRVSQYLAGGCLGRGGFRGLGKQEEGVSGDLGRCERPQSAAGQIGVDPTLGMESALQRTTPVAKHTHRSF